MFHHDWARAPRRGLLTVSWEEGRQVSAVIEAKVISWGRLFLGINYVLDMIQSLLGHSMWLRQYLRVYRKLLEAVEDQRPQ